MHKCNLSGLCIVPVFISITYLFSSCTLEMYICDTKMTYQYLDIHLLLVSPLTVYLHRVLMPAG